MAKCSTEMSDRHVCTDTCTSTAFCTELGNDLDYSASARTKQKLEQSVLGESCLHWITKIHLEVSGHITYLIALLLLTPWCRVLLEKLTGLQLVKKFPVFYGTRRLITALTSVRHLSLSWASPIQSTYPHPTSWRSILILSTHLSLSLPSGLFPSRFPSKTLSWKLCCFTWRALQVISKVKTLM